MRRRDLEHLMRAAADLTDDDELIVIGSQAILGQYPDAPPELCVSTEADVHPKNKPSGRTARRDLRSLGLPTTSRAEDPWSDRRSPRRRR